MGNFLPIANSVSSELLENLNILHKKLPQSKNGKVLFDLKVKLGSLSVKRSVLGKIWFHVTAVDYKDREYNDAEELLCSIIYKVFHKTAYFVHLKRY